MLCAILGISRSALCASVNNLIICLLTVLKNLFFFIISFSLLSQQLSSSCLQVFTCSLNEIEPIDDETHVHSVSFL